MLSISREVEVNPLGPVQLHDPPLTGCGPRLTVDPLAADAVLVCCQAPPPPVVVPVADLSIVKSATPPKVSRVGDVISYSFVVTNNGTKVTKEKARDVLNYVVEDAKKDFTITRFKGLGEMNAEQLWDTTMNAETRTLLQVRLEDAVAAEDIFTTLMGENVEARRKFIEENALEVVNLDI